MKKEKRIYIAGYIMLAAAIVCFALFLDKTVDYRLDSDDASEMILARLLAGEKSLLSGKWYYSTELRVLNTQLVFAPLFLFLKNWHTIRVTGTVILALCLLLSLHFLFLKLELLPVFPFAAVMLLVPFSEEYYHFVLEKTYYIPHICITFILLGVLLSGKLEETSLPRKTSIGVIAASFLLSFLSGLGGLRQIVVCQAPLLAATLILFLLESRKAEFGKQREQYLSVTRKRQIFVGSVVAFLGVLVGYITNRTCLSPIYHFDSFSEIDITAFSTERFITTLRNFFVSFGYDDGMHGKMTVITNVFSVVFLLFAFISAFMNCFNLRTPWKSRLLSIIFLCGVIELSFLFSMTDMQQNVRYNLPIAVLAIPVVAGEISRSRFRNSACLLLSVVVFSIGIGYYAHNITWVCEESEHQEIADFLKTERYTTGYSTFWNGNVLTELTNGKVDVHVWCDDDASIMRVNQTFKWLQLTAHDTEVPDGKVFCLFNKEKLDNCLWREQLRAEDIVFETKSFVLYGYQNYQNLKQTSFLRSYEYHFDNDLFSQGCITKNGERQIPENGVSFGPYIPAAENRRYRVTFTGKQLSDAEIQVYSMPENIFLKPEYEYLSDEKLVFSVETQKELSAFEIAIRNCNHLKGANHVVLTSEVIEMLDETEYG